MSRFDRFAMAFLGLATVGLYGGCAVITLRDSIGYRPVAPAATAQAPVPVTHPAPVAAAHRSGAKTNGLRATSPLRGGSAGPSSPLLHRVSTAVPLVPTIPVPPDALAAPKASPAAADDVPAAAPDDTTGTPAPDAPSAQAAAMPVAVDSKAVTAVSASVVTTAETEPTEAAPAHAPLTETAPEAHNPDVVVTVPLAEPDAADAAVANTETNEATAIVTSVGSMAELADTFRDADYRFSEIVSGKPVPAIIIRRFPPDLRDEEAAEQRKLMFLQTLLPIVLFKNQEIRRDRERLLPLRDAIHRGDPLDPGETDWLVRLFSRYQVERGDIDELVDRVDVIPPSLALAQAATESGWGTSRSAREGNALFGQYATIGDTYAIRSFDALLKSAQSYALNLNTHRAYRVMRAKRAEMRNANKPLDGYVLAAALDSYSELGKKYVRYVRRMIKDNQLSALDQARLAGDETTLASDERQE